MNVKYGNFKAFMEKWFSEGLIAWYRLNKRDLPWRNEQDAYKIWLSEVILQQTQVTQGLSYYLKFTQTYPTVKNLAKASEDQVLRLWQGLGYYSRARNMHASAKMIVEQHKGVFPNSYEDIRELKGIGDYTASAIASFAFNLPHAVVDGNVYRLLSRVFGIKTPIDSTLAKKEFQQLANQLLNTKNPATHNQAIMEFGSQFCKPVNPDCENCIFSNKCFAFKHSQVQLLPVKAKKTKVRNRFFNYLVLMDPKKEVVLYRRSKGDIWEGLYEFQLIETSQQLEREDLLKSAEFKALRLQKHNLTYVSKLYKHILSHQHLYARFYVLSLHEPLKTKISLRDKVTQQTKTSLGKLNNFAFPRLIAKFLDDCELKEML